VDQHPSEDHRCDAGRKRQDGNNVSMDREARMLSENALRFNLVSALMKTQMKLMTDAIEEGKTG
jgi:flagellar basal-body rod protein FlgB